jgi:myo-inositol-1(or 4)-monophosphatase
MTRVGSHPAALTDLAERVAREAAAFVAGARRRGRVGAATKSTATDMVTEFDHASEQLIVTRLLAARPDDAVVAEEGATARGSTGITWLVDPIDGTTNYLYGLPGFAVSIGAADGDGPLLGVVVIPSVLAGSANDAASGTVYRAWRAGGAWCGAQRISCSDRTDLAQTLLATGFSYEPARRRMQATRVARLIDHVRDIRRLGAAAADLCYVAAGHVDAYFEEHLNPWDIAAGRIIATEAGCRVGALDGGPVRNGSVLAAPPALFDALVALIAEADDTDAAPRHASASERPDP